MPPFPPSSSSSPSPSLFLLLLAVLLACAQSHPRTTTPPSPSTFAAGIPHPASPGERHFTDLRQLTFGGENAEAYWSSRGTELIYQARTRREECDRIYRMSLVDPRLGPRAVSDGKGVTTCSFFLPGDREVVFSSTHLAGPECPAPPDHSHGYVWPLRRAYDIFRANADGSNVRRLTDTDGYDAEATVCPRDGAIVFTSVRDGDLDLYRMDADGKNVRRLTSQVGYDGGAFFSPDCTRIVWRASRPKAGQELEDYRRLLSRDLVRPGRLELWVANADGSDPMQLTYLDVASFAPSFHPKQERVIFSSNHRGATGREFDLWAIDIAGTRLERLTTSLGFDGFPMFSPDGTHLAFASNRATAPGQSDTNVFVARWNEGAVQPFEELAADRILADVRWLADPERGGRGIGTPGLDAATSYLEGRFQRLGLMPAGDSGTFRQRFEVPTAVRAEPDTRLSIAAVEIGEAEFRPAAYSGQGSAAAPVVLAGYGISDPELGVDDYAGLDVKGKIVLVRRFAPSTPAFEKPEAQRRAGDVRRKAFAARERGAVALLVVDAPPASSPTAPSGAPDEAPFPPLRADGYGDAGIPVLFVKRAAVSAVLAKLEKRALVRAALTVKLSITRVSAYNVVGRVSAGSPEDRRLPGVVVIGAHYDHLGLGERHSLAPDSHLPHLGADDNASGTAGLLEAARLLVARRGELRRDVVLVAFSGEEEGALGSTHFTRSPPAGFELQATVAMLNLDMVGRLRDNRVTVLGRGSAEEWPQLLDAACQTARIDCSGQSGGADGYGPSDQMPFYAAGIPVAHFFTGNHSDYHRPSDSADKINAAGAGQIAVAVGELALAIAARPTGLTFVRFTGEPHRPGVGDMRTFGASLGTIPDYAGPPDGAKGVLLAGVRAGGAAEIAGLRRGDVLIRLGRHEIGSVEDLMYALGASKPGETATAVVRRNGAEVKLPVTFQQGRAPKQ